MQKSFDLLSIPASLVKSILPATSLSFVKHWSIFNRKKNQDLGPEATISDALVSLITKTQKLFSDKRELESVKHLATEVKNEKQANHVLFVFSNLIASLEDGLSSEQEKLFSLPGKIIDNFSFPDIYLEKSIKLKIQCSKISNLDSYHKSIHDVVSLLHKVYIDSISEKKELEKFLLNVGVQISRIGDQVHEFVEEHSSDLKIQNDLNAKMHNAVNNLGEDLLQANDLDGLKNTVKAQLDSLQNLVLEERQVVKKHELSIKENMSFLATRVNDLKKEAKQLKERVKKEQENALRDSMTGLFNREAYNNKLKSLVIDVEKNNDVVSLLVWDIDHFKKFNDLYGHMVGDKVLLAVTSKLSSFIKDKYFLARYGGEEFVMLLPSVDANGAFEFAKKIKQEVSQIKYLLKAKPLKVTISCGIAEMRDKDQAKDIFERADKALYEAKISGRNCVKLETGIKSA